MAEVVGKMDVAELEKLQPVHPEFIINGEVVQVKEFTFGKLLKAVKHLSKLLNILVEMQESEDSTVASILVAFSYHTDDVVALISLATDKDPSFFDDIDAETGLDIATAVYEVNKSFFEKNLLPKVSSLFAPSTETPAEEEEVQSKAKKSKKGVTDGSS